MRVALVSDRLSHENGGIHESVFGLARELDRGTTGEFASFGFCRDGELEDRWDGLQVFPLSAEEQWFPISRTLARAVEEWKPDVIHLHGLWGIATRSLGTFPSSCPHLLSPHGMLQPWAMNRSAFKKRVSWQLWERALSTGGAFHALNLAEKNALEERGISEPIHVVPNGVALPTRKPLEEREKVILFFSRLHPMKGLGALIEGWARIASDFPDWRVDVAGWEEGGYGRECEILAKRLGLSRQIRFIGPKFGPEKADCLASVAGLAQPSLNEGLPMSILEAWSYGTPTLMSDHCHLPEGFQRGAAIKINPTSESVAEGLRRFLSLGELDRGNMGAAGRTLVEERFRWGEVGQRFLEIYEEMAG